MNIEERINEYLNKQQAGKALKDTERRVRFTRKELMAFKMISRENLSDLEEDPEFADEYLKKDKVYPKLNIQVEMDGIVSSPTAYCKQMVRKAFPAKTQYLDGLSPNGKKLFRTFYLNLASFFHSAFENVKSIDEFDRKFYTIKKLPFIKVCAFVMVPSAQNYIDGFTPNTETSIDMQLESLFTFISSIDDEKVNPNEVYDLFKFIEERNNTAQYYLYKSDNFIRFLVVTGYKRFAKALGEIDTSEIDWQFGIKTQEDVAKQIEKLAGYDKQRLLKIVEFKKRYPKLDFFSQIYDLIEETFPSTGFPIWSRQDGKWKHIYAKKVLNGEQYVDEEQQKSYFERVEKYADEVYQKLQSSIDSIESKYNARDQEDWSWAGEKKNPENAQDGKKKSSSELTANEWEPLSYIQRTGGLKIDEETIKTDEGYKRFFKDVFGIERITFGATLPSNESIVHIKHSTGALSDFAEILDIDSRQIGLLSDLGITYGAQGRGKASATYHAATRSINITRRRGDGALCHELGHYLDHALAVKIATSFDRERLNSRYLSDMAYKYVFENKSLSTELYSNPVMVAMISFFQLLKTPKNFQVPQEFAADFEKATNGKKIRFYARPDAVKRFRYSSLSKEKTLTIDQTIERIKEQYPSYQNQYYYENKRVKPSFEQLYGGLIAYYELDEYWIEFPHWTASSLLVNSRNMKSPYWSEPWELFARSWECYVFDKLAGKARTSNYLVSGTYFDHPSGVYPAGVERSIINLIFDKLVEAVKENLKIQDFVGFTDEREDIYEDFGTLPENTEVAKDSVEVDSETVVDKVETMLPEEETNSGEAMQRKVEKLVSILSERANAIKVKATTANNLYKEAKELGYKAIRITYYPVYNPRIHDSMLTQTQIKELKRPVVKVIDLFDTESSDRFTVDDYLLTGARLRREVERIEWV